MDINKLKEVFGEWPLRVGEFQKVSYAQFKKDWLDTFCEPGDAELRESAVIEDAYDTLTLPVRATSGSAGNDFFSPIGFVLEPDEEIKIPTGIKAYILDGFYLECVPKSGLGFKYYVRMSNTVGIVDSDYAYSSNDGHIFIKIRNEGNKRMTINKGDKLFQGIFKIFGITYDDNAKDVRDGGFGSTGA